MERESLWDSLQSGCQWMSDVYVDTSSSDQPLMTSTSFFPGARGKEANIVFCSLDCVHFFVDSIAMSAVAINAFREELAGVNYQDVQPFGPAVVFIPEPSPVLDVMLHFLHNLAFPANVPTFQTLFDGISAMSRYSIDPKLLLIPSNACYNHVLFLAPAHPVEVFALAASLDIYPLAAACSSHLLSYPLKYISDELATLMGGVYLKRLSGLQSHRREMLKSILKEPPYPHPPKRDCDFVRQKQLARAWRMTAGHFVWEAQCDLSPAVIQSSFDTLKTYVDCDHCREMLDNRVKEAISQWILVKRTI